MRRLAVPGSQEKHVRFEIGGRPASLFGESLFKLLRKLEVRAFQGTRQSVELELHGDLATARVALTGNGAGGKDGLG